MKTSKLAVKYNLSRDHNGLPTCEELKQIDHSMCCGQFGCGGTEVDEERLDCSTQIRWMPLDKREGAGHISLVDQCQHFRPGFDDLFWKIRECPPFARGPDCVGKTLFRYASSAYSAPNRHQVVTVLAPKLCTDHRPTNSKFSGQLALKPE